MRRILFAEGRDEAALRTFARGLACRWRLLARPEQTLFLLEAEDPGEEAERAAGSLDGVKTWAFDVVGEGPTD